MFLSLTPPLSFAGISVFPSPMLSHVSPLIPFRFGVKLQENRMSKTNTSGTVSEETQKLFIRNFFSTGEFPERIFGKWLVSVVPEKGGLVAEFRDMTEISRFYPRGRLVSSYYVRTLLGKDSWSNDSIRNFDCLSLYGSEPEWTVRQPELAQIADWLEGFEEVSE